MPLAAAVLSSAVQSIRINVMGDTGGLCFKVTPTTRMDAIFGTFCRRKELSRSQTRFLFDGARVQGSETVAELMMHDGDVIDAICESCGD